MGDAPGLACNLVVKGAHALAILVVVVGGKTGTGYLDQGDVWENEHDGKEEDVNTGGVMADPELTSESDMCCNHNYLVRTKYHKITKLVKNKNNNHLDSDQQQYDCLSPKYAANLDGVYSNQEEPTPYLRVHDVQACVELPWGWV